MDVGTECDGVREELSARLDGEDSAEGRDMADAHLRDCGACHLWWEQVQQMDRVIRTAAALPAPGLSPQAIEAVLAAAPQQRPARAAKVLRLALLTVGLAQFLLGVAQISDMAGGADAHVHAGGVSVSSGHLWHESAAWNVAIGAALAWLAWRRIRAAALLPMMTAFVVVLALLTANDAVAGQVEAGRVVSHGLVLVGYALLLALNHPRLRDGQPSGAVAVPNRGWSLRNDGDDGPLAPVIPFPVRIQTSTSAQATVQTRRAA